MKCYHCQKEQDVLLRGMCPPCFKVHGEKEPGVVGEVMGVVAQALVDDPGRLHRTPPDYKAQRDLLRSALLALVDEDDPVKLKDMLMFVEKEPGEDPAVAAKAIRALLATVPEEAHRG